MKLTNSMKFKRLITGLATFLPGSRLLHRPETGGTNSARYCYSVWLRHLLHAYWNQAVTTHPKVVVELGPGDSIGIGLAALLTGADQYQACDVVKYADLRRNLAVFDELVVLFRMCAEIPTSREFHNIKPPLTSVDFPSSMLPVELLEQTLSETRVRLIRESIQYPNAENSMIQYVVPWHDPSIIEPESVDMILSQAVLEHVDDLENAYSSMRLWLRDGGLASHQIDFKSHGTAHEWNGHWAYSDLIWKLIRGRRPYLINRRPASYHVELLTKNGFRIVGQKRVTNETGITRKQLSRRFSNLAEEDLHCSGMFVQAVKSNASS